jgi:murein DD-endopeptidase / murein LD-carboxypeptidase
MYTFTLIFATAVAGMFAVSSCTGSRNIAQKVNAIVIADTPGPIVPTTSVKKEYDSIQVEYAGKLAVPCDSIHNLSLYRFIKLNLGKKCVSQANGKSNCGSFLARLFKNVYALDIPDLVEKQASFKKIELYRDTSYLKEGDVLFFSIAAKQRNTITHAGLYLHNGYFLIATNNEGVIIAGLSKTFWSKNFIAAGRINKLKEQRN